LTIPRHEAEDRDGLTPTIETMTNEAFARAASERSPRF
jgi:hypothetical protein